MDTQLVSTLRGTSRKSWEALLQKAGLEPDTDSDSTVLIWDDAGDLIATASRRDNLLKCIAVDPFRQGEGLTATLLTQLRQDAFQAG